MEAKKLALLCKKLADNKKAEDIVVLDVRKLSSVTDYFVIVTGTSEPHLRAIELEILGTLLEEHGIRPTNTEGNAQANWVVADFFDVIVHIMKKDVREKYDLEGLWGDAPQAKEPAPRKKKEKSTPAPTGTEPAAKAPAKSRARAKAKPASGSADVD